MKNKGDVAVASAMAVGHKKGKERENETISSTTSYLSRSLILPCESILRVKFFYLVYSNYARYIIIAVQIMKTACVCVYI